MKKQDKGQRIGTGSSGSELQVSNNALAKYDPIKKKGSRQRNGITSKNQQPVNDPILGCKVVSAPEQDYSLEELLDSVPTDVHADDDWGIAGIEWAFNDDPANISAPK